MRNTSSGWEQTIAAGPALRNPAFSPDGHSVAWLDTRDSVASIRVSSMNGEQPWELTRSHDVLQSPSWSADGNWIAYAREHDGRWSLWKSRADAGAPPVKIADNAGQTAAWSPAGGTIASVRPDSGVNLVSLDGKIRTLGTGRWLAAAWSGDGRLIGLRENSGRLELTAIDASSGAEHPLSGLGPGPAINTWADAIGLPPVRGIAVSNAGRNVVYARLVVDSSIWLMKGIAEPPRW